jgi:glycerophosphoryl diester phosphodiesterase
VLTSTSTKPIIFAHRGASGYEPENTLRSFSRAITLGATWIELDVRVADHLVWVFHDSLLLRRAHVNRALAELSSSEIRTLDVGLGEKVPLLTEVLDLVRGKASINIEIKGIGAVPYLVKILQSALESGWKSDQFLISSFDFCLRAKRSAT